MKHIETECSDSNRDEQIDSPESGMRSQLEGDYEYYTRKYSQRDEPIIGIDARSINRSLRKNKQAEICDDCRFN